MLILKMTLCQPTFPTYEEAIAEAKRMLMDFFKWEEWPGYMIDVECYGQNHNDSYWEVELI